MARISLILIPLIFLIGCAATDDRPIVDMQGVNIAQYNIDLSECRAYADEVEAGRKIARGTIGGAVVGGVVGAVIGDSDIAQRTAGAGAVLGASEGAGSAIHERRRVVHNCLRGRGYRVLN
ncbi:MAG: glycine zipper family protein [Gammaproteobacteria bacterium]|nr:glycine zipper family protein [Gammaproteobacteria bacterium]